MNREPSVFPVAPATVFPAESKPGVPDGLCDQRGAPMSTPDHDSIARESLQAENESLRARATQAEQERNAAEAVRDEVFAVIERQHVQSSDQQVNEELHAARAEVVALRTALEAATRRLQELAAAWQTEPAWYRSRAENEAVRALAVLSPPPKITRAARAALGSTTEPRQAALTMAVVEEAAYVTAAVYVDGDGESAAWMVRDLIVVLAGSTTEPEEKRTERIRGTTGRYPFPLVEESHTEPEETGEVEGFTYDAHGLTSDGPRAVGRNVTAEPLEPTTEPEETRKRPLLGHATTRELLTEIKARGEVSHTIGEYPEEMGSMAIGAANILDGLPGSMLDYRTVGAEPEEAEK